MSHSERGCGRTPARARSSCSVVTASALASPDAPTAALTRSSQASATASAAASTRTRRG